jgi:hypothetical protein
VLRREKRGTGRTPGAARCSREPPAWLTIAYRLSIIGPARNDGAPIRKAHGAKQIVSFGRGRNVGTLLRILFWLFAALYAFALIVFFGVLFGAIRGGSLAGIFLIPLGMPWVLFAGHLPLVLISGFRLSWWAGLLAPAINLLILYLLMRRTRRRAA